MSSNPQQVLSDLFDVLEDATSSTAKRIAFQNIAYQFQSSKNVRLSLTANSRKTEGDIEIDWQYVFSKAVEEVIQVTPIKKGFFDVNWIHMGDVIDVAEKEGHFMGHIVDDLFTEMLKVIRSQATDVDMTKLLPIFSKISQAILCVPEYQIEVRETSFQGMFDFVSSLFQQSLANRPKDNKLECIKLHPLLSAQLLSFLVVSYPYSMDSFLAKQVFPFYTKYVMGQAPDTPATFALLGCLNTVLRTQAISVSDQLMKFCSSVAKVLTIDWALRSSQFKKEIVELYNICLRVENYFADKKERKAKLLKKWHQPLYRAFLDDLRCGKNIYSSNDAHIISTQFSRREKLQRKALIDKETYSFLHILGELVERVEPGVTPAVKLEKDNLAKNEEPHNRPAKRQKKQNFAVLKRQQSERRPSIWDFSQPCTVFFQFLAVFCHKRCSYFWDDSGDFKLFRHIVATLGSQIPKVLSMKDFELNTWRLACVSSLVDATAKLKLENRELRELWGSIWGCVSTFVCSCSVSLQQNSLFTMALTVASKIAQKRPGNIQKLTGISEILQCLPFFKVHVVSAGAVESQHKHIGQEVSQSDDRPVFNDVEVLSFPPTGSTLSFLQAYPSMQIFTSDKALLSRLLNWLVRFYPNNPLLSGPHVKISNNAVMALNVILQLCGGGSGWKKHIGSDFAFEEPAWMLAGSSTHILQSNAVLGREALQQMRAILQFSPLASKAPDAHNVQSATKPVCKNSVVLQSICDCLLANASSMQTLLERAMDHTRHKAKSEFNEQANTIRFRTLLYYLKLAIGVLDAFDFSQPIELTDFPSRMWSSLRGAVQTKLAEVVKICISQLAVTIRLSCRASENSLQKKPLLSLSSCLFLQSTISNDKTLRKLASDQASQFAELSGEIVRFIILSLSFVYNSSGSAGGTVEAFETSEFRDEDFSSSPATSTDRPSRSTAGLISSLLKTLFRFIEWGIQSPEKKLKHLETLLDPNRDVNSSLAEVENGTGIGKFLSFENFYFILWAFLINHDCRVRHSFTSLLQWLERISHRLKSHQQSASFIFQLLQFLTRVASALSASGVEIPDEKLKSDIHSLFEEITDSVYQSKLDRDCRLLLVRWTMQGVESQLISIPDGLAGFFSDQDFSVRIFFARQTKVLYEVFEASQNIYDSLESLFLEKVNSKEDITTGECITSIAVLVQSAMTLPEFEGPVVMNLCLLSEKIPKFRPLIKCVYNQMEARLGYVAHVANESSSSLLEDVLFYTLSKWLSHSRPIETFPHALLKHSDCATPSPAASSPAMEFVIRHQALIVVNHLLILHQNRRMSLSGLSRVCELTGISLPNLLTSHFPCIAATMLALDSGVGARSCQVDLNPDLEGEAEEDQEWIKQSQAVVEFLKSNLDGKLEEMLVEKQDEVLVCILELPIEQESPLMPTLGHKNLRNVLNGLMKHCKCKSSSLGDFLCPQNGDRMHQIVAQIRRKMSTTCRPKRRTYYFGLVGLLLDEIGWRAQIPSVFRFFLDLLLWSLSLGDTIRSVQLIHVLCRAGLCAQASQHSEQGVAVAWHIQELVSALVDCAKVSADVTVKTSCIECIEEVLSSMPEQLQCCFELLAPFPLLPHFDNLNEQLTKCRGSRSLAQTLFYIGKGLQMAPFGERKIRVNLLHYLLKTVECKRENITALLNQLDINRVSVQQNRSKSRRSSGDKPLLAHLVSELNFVSNADSELDVFTSLLGYTFNVCVASSVDQEDDEIRTIAAKCLGKIGMLDSAFVRNLLIFHQKSSNFASRGYVNPDVALVGSFFNKPHSKEILILLKDYLRQPNPKVASCSAIIIKCIFEGDGNAEDPSRDFNELPLETRIYLEPFFHATANKRRANTAKFKERRQNSLPLSPEIPLPEALTEEEDILRYWTPSGKTFKAWICTLTVRLIQTRVKDHHLRSCLSVCALDHKFASFLFPWVVFDALYEDSRRNHSSSSCRFLASALNQTAALVGSLDSGMSSSTAAKFLSVLFSSLQCVFIQQIITRRQPIDKENKKRNRLLIDIMRSIDVKFQQNLDLLLLASCAQKRKLFFTSLRFLELWHRCRFGGDWAEGSMVDSMESGLAASPVHLSPVEFAQDLSLGEEDEGLKLFKILVLEAHQNIDEPDSIYGVLQGALLNENIVTDSILASREGDWASSLQLADNILQLGLPPQSLDGVRMESITTSVGLASALQNLGCFHTLQGYLGYLHTGNPVSGRDVQERHMEAAWRTGNWDLDLSVKTPSHSNTEGGMHAALFESLRWFRNSRSSQHDLQPVALQEALSQSRCALLVALAEAGAESIKIMTPTIASLQMLADVDSIWGILQANQNPSEQVSFLLKVEALWKQRLPHLIDQFAEYEPVMALRAALLDTLGHDMLFARQLRLLVDSSIQAGTPASKHVGLNVVRRVECNPRMGVFSKLAIKLKGAELAWERGDHALAIRTSKGIFRSVQFHRKLAKSAADEHSVTRLLVNSLTSTGEWLSRSHSENVEVIKSQYLDQALKLAKSLHVNESQESLIRVHFQYGRFMDRVFVSLLAEKNSVEYEAATQLYNKNLRQLTQLKALEKQIVAEVQKNKDAPGAQNALKEARDLRQYSSRLQFEHDLDVKERRHFERQISDSLHSAIKHYCKCLHLGDTFDSGVIYRLITLWFSHLSVSPNVVASKNLYSLIQTVPSIKFIPLVYQIASRLDIVKEAGISDSEALFRDSVRVCITKLALEHPHHSLYQIFALCNGDRLAATSKNTAGFAAKESRLKAARSLVSQLKSSAHKELVSSMEALIQQYVAIGNANNGVRGTEGRANFLELKKTGLAKLRSRVLRNIPIPTYTILPQKNCKYPIGGSSPCIVEFYKQIHYANSGINRPLILRIRGTDGVWHKQLIKSADDLRQDAVMEQVFGLVNGLLSEKPETRRRRLQIRTYNVVPLTPCVGLVEWVNKTTSLFELLTNSTRGLHSRYRPKAQRKSFMEWFKHLKEGHVNDKSSLPVRYKQVCEDFKPCFHRFFLESYPDPAQWFHKRLTYTRSMAVNSMVGYMVGLGDRHNNNILLDMQTAEVVHIDLGVAFDIGKVLKTPEIVPFRLTRDLVDGFGMTGVEGVFRRCCEGTLRVLRTNQERLLTVLEVFLHDPLYKWALSPDKMEQLRPVGSAAASTSSAAIPENGSAADANEPKTSSGALRALNQVRKKLAGTELKDELSVEGQANALINTAKDPNRLCAMYYGWAAFV